MTKLAEQHPQWKGNEVGYMGVHAWLRTHYNQLKKICEHCSGSKNLQFAKKKDSKYTRNISDYLILCASCHGKYDKQGIPAWNKGNVAVYPKKCEYCQIDFDAKKKTNRFCSNKCSGKWRFEEGLTSIIPGANDFIRLALNKK